MHRRPLVPTTARVGHRRIILDHLTGEIGPGAPADQQDTDRNSGPPTGLLLLFRAMLMYLSARRHSRDRA